MSQAASFFLCCLLLLLPLLATSDSDPVQDFYIPDPGTAGKPLDLTRLSTYPCKNPANVTAVEFVFAGIQSPGTAFSAQTGFAGLSVTPVLFPALHTLGMSFARADFQPGGVNPPHYHPRSTETALVLSGRVYTGFVDTGGRVFAQVVEAGEVVVFPRGMVHFQMNVDQHAPASVYGSFNSENPGIVRIPATVFGSEIRDALLEKAFALSRDEVEYLRKKFKPA